MKTGKGEYLVEFRADVSPAENFYCAGHKVKTSVSTTVITPLLKQKSADVVHKIKK